MSIENDNEFADAGDEKIEGSDAVSTLTEAAITETVAEEAVVEAVVENQKRLFGEWCIGLNGSVT